MCDLTNTPYDALAIEHPRFSDNAVHLSVDWVCNKNTYIQSRKISVMPWVINPPRMREGYGSRFVSECVCVCVMRLSIKLLAPPPPVGDKRGMVGDLTISLINIPSPGTN